MSGSHMAPRSAQQKKSSSAGKTVLLVVVLLIVIAALCFLLWQLFGDTILERFGGGSGGTANIAPGIFTQVEATSSSGKNVAGNLSVTQSTQRPDTIPPEEEDVVLLDIAWGGNEQPTEPVYVTVSDPSFPDGDGLAVHHLNSATNAWDLLGTYTIQNNSVTFMTDSFSPFAFQVISSTPEPTPEPTATPEPTVEPTATPEPTPVTIEAVDYGSYPTVQSGVFAMVNELEDDAVYVLAAVRDLPAGATAVGEETAEETEDTDAEKTEDELPEDETVGDVNFSYVDADDATQVAEAPVDAAAAADTAAAAGPAPMATVLVNLDGSSMTTVDMPLLQAEDGSWCLAGPITEGMLWTANRDAYKTEHRFSFASHDRYLNLDDSNANVILDDDSTRTRFLLETATLTNGSEITTLNYRNDDRYYVNAMDKSAEVATDDAFPAGSADPASVSTPVFLGGAAPEGELTLYRDVMHFTVSTDQATTKQLLAFRVDDTLTAPAGSVTSLAHQITVPAINADTNLETLVIMDGAKTLVLGTDYTISARVYNNSTVVVSIDFMGDYSGRIVRTYSGTLIRTNATPETTPAPEPTPTPYVGGEGWGYEAPEPQDGGGGGGTEEASSGTTDPGQTEDDS